MERANDPAAPSRSGLSYFVGPCRIAGSLRDHGAYPGFFPPEASVIVAVEPQIVEAELHRLVSLDAFEIFDRYEDYDPNDEAASLYIRRKIRLLEPDVEAWVYFSQLSRRDPVVPQGDWATYRRARV